MCGPAGACFAAASPTLDRYADPESARRNNHNPRYPSQDRREVLILDPGKGVVGYQFEGCVPGLVLESFIFRDALQAVGVAGSKGGEERHGQRDGQAGKQEQDRLSPK